MKKAIIGRKVGMTQIFDEIGNVIPVTLIEAGPCAVVQKKTTEKDGYEALQLGFMEIPERKISKAAKGHFDKAGVSYEKLLANENAELATSLGVKQAPTLVIQKNGTVEKISGVSDIKKHLGV